MNQMNEMNQMNQDTLSGFYKLVEDYSLELRKVDTSSIVGRIVTIYLRNYPAATASEFIQVLRATGVSHNSTTSDEIRLYPNAESTNAVIAVGKGEDVRFLPFPLVKGNQHKYVVIVPNKDIETVSTFVAKAIRTEKSITILRSVESEMVFSVQLS